ncbi:MAG: hypothetical protein M1814_006837 [Vezdaea aestivalis]|nr:MAG: hypothetical protein M1814_006837 [Vezdaea aestivalis]
MSLIFSLQALLARHEAFVADAEHQRKQMHDSFEALEMEKRQVEEANSKVIEENRSLLCQLEELNNELTESDTNVKSLTAALCSSQQELQRLTVLTTRTTSLELQLMELEQERAQLQTQALTSKEAERDAMQRWHRSERMLADLHDQVEKIEKEAQEERERHVEVVGRLERRRVVEKELSGAAGRLKGAAAASSVGKGQSGTNVVSHFVKDILQDNANLQLGIVELRDMLANSNDEVQVLREQLMLHRPTDAVPAEAENNIDNLQAELGSGFETPRNISQELHFHHHYHPKVSESPSNRPSPRRVKRRRPSIQPGMFQGSHRCSPSLTPTSSPTSHRASSSTASTILSQTSVTVPPTHSPTDLSNYQSSTFAAGSTTRSSRNKRTSVALSLSTAASSVPNSPQSAGYLFDVLGEPLDVSRPTTPGSSVASPPFGPIDNFHSRKASSASFRSFTSPGYFQPPPTSTALPFIPPQTLEEDTPTEPSPPLRRRASVLSISSIQGMDIHTSNAPHSLRSRPSQLTIRPSAPSIAIVPSTTITAIAPMTRGKWKSAAFNQSLLSAAEQDSQAASQSRSVSGPVASGVKPLGKKTSALGLGGWIASKWGVSATPTEAVESAPDITPAKDGPDQLVSATDDLHPVSQPISISPPKPSKLTSDGPTSSDSQPTPTSPPTMTLAGLKWGGNAIPSRRPGVNQAGAIPGWKKPTPLPQAVQITREVDMDALGASLRE